MVSPASTIDAELEAVTAALAAVEPGTKRLVLFGSRARALREGKELHVAG